MHLNPYLGFDGCCAEAFRFYESALGGTGLHILTHRGTPMEDHVPPDWLDKVLHARVTVGGVALMGSDAPPGRYRKPEGMSVSLQVEAIEEGTRLFQALAEGGTVTMPFAQTFWAKRFGMVTDRFGIPWMVNCE